MISATSLNASSALNKGPQIPLGIENGRFLVPSLPVSARAVSNHHNGDPKRRERSIVNGTAHPSSDSHYSHHHSSISHNFQNHSINGLRSPYNPHGSGGLRDSNGPSSPHNSNNSNSQRASPHHPYLNLNNSPRKDAHSPMYAGEVPGLSPGGNYSMSSMPVPCSSPAQASSASPKGSHSHSPSAGAAGNYSPKLPNGPPMLPPPSAGATDLSTLAATGRLYPGFPPPHPSVAAHLSPAFYAAAAAAAASHPLPFFGAHYNPHSHSAAAASAYLDSFHSALVNRGPSGDVVQVQQRSRSPSPSPPSRTHGAYHSAQSYQQQQQSHGHSHHNVNQHQSTSVTSLHNKLIESTAVSSERHSYSGHHHVPSSQFSPQSAAALGLSKGGPLGISGGIMNLPSTRLSNGTSPHKHAAQAENLVVHNKSNVNNTNGYHLSPKSWAEHSSRNSEAMHKQKIQQIAEMEAKERHHSKEMHMKQRISQSAEDMSIQHSTKININNNRFTNNHHPSNYAHMNGHHIAGYQNHGILTDSNHTKKQMNAINNNNNHQPNNHIHPSQHFQQHQSPQSQSQFLPPSPKKRSAQWNFAVPASKVELPPPPPPQINSNLVNISHSHATSGSHHESSKYLNHNQNFKPSNQHHSLPVPNSTSINTTYLSPGQSAQQHSYPNSPRSGPSTPKSPSVHQVKFSFSSGSTKENLHEMRANSKSVRNDSSSSTSSNEGNIPWPVEQMPMLEAFRRGSLIKLASGDLRPVEDLRAEDFIHAAANMSDTLRIIHCTVLSIQNDGGSLCKVTMTVGSQLQNQQVVVPSTPEQPFFVLGRGWSSLSPKTTEKLLQLSCSPLAVGDVCITLSKTSMNSVATGSKSSPQVPKSPSVRGRGAPRKNLNNSNINSKRSQQQQVPSSPTARGRKPATVTNFENQQISLVTKQPTVLSQQSAQVTMTIPINPLKRSSMGPPLTVTTSSTTTIPTAMAKSLGVEDLGPLSPKRRRWSAPEPEIPDGSSKTDKSEEKKSPTKDVTLTPISPPAVPVSTKESNHSSASTNVGDNKTPTNGNKMDVNSNVSNVNTSCPSTDAQSAKA